MHNYVMGKLGKYVEETYCCPEKFTKCDLQELENWGKAMYYLLKADKEYNIVKQMEEGNHSSIDMEWDEFVTRFKRMYEESNSVERQEMTDEIMKIVS